MPTPPDMEAVAVAPTAHPVGAPDTPAQPGRRPAGGATLRALARDRAALAGTLFIAIVALAALAAPLIAPHDPLAGDLARRLQPPGTPGFPLGTDGQGRDVLSRIIWGGRLSLLGAILPVAVSGIVGYTLGLVAGYFHHRLVDSIIMRVLDIFYAFPAVILAIGISAALGPGFLNVTLSLIVVIVPAVARIAYASTVSVMGREYIEAARAAGARPWQVVVYQVVPNSFAPVLVYCTTLVGLVLVFASGLSFLGLGIQPPTPEWGAMIGQLKDSVFTAPWVITMPGLVILGVSIAFNVVGDALRDALDPQLRTT